MATSKKTAPAKPPVEEVVDDEVEGIDEEDGAEGDDPVINLEEVEESGEYTPMPRGTYNCEVANVEYGFSQSSGNPMWTVTLDVMDDGYEGRKLFTHLVWAGKGLPRTKQACAQIFHEQIPDLSQVRPRALAESGELVGVRCRARVNIRLYEGQKRNNVQNLMAPSDDD